MRLRNQDDDNDDDDDDVDEASVGRRRQDGRLPMNSDHSPRSSPPAADAARPGHVHLRPLVPASAAADVLLVKATSSTSSSQLSKSRSETLISDVLANTERRHCTATDSTTSKCRLALSKSTADWTALYQRS